MEYPLHITLTRKNSKIITSNTIRDIVAAFRKLRQTELFKRCVKGGIYSVEVTNTGKGWHVHMHVLCDCRWLALRVRAPHPACTRARKKELYQAASRELHDAWCRVIGQKRASIHVRRCAAADGIREVLKYAVKGDDLVDCEGVAAECIIAMQRCRMMSPFGSLYKLRAELKEPDKEPCKCPDCQRSGTIVPEQVREMIVRSAYSTAPALTEAEQTSRRIAAAAAEEERAFRRAQVAEFERMNPAMPFVMPSRPSTRN